MTNDPDELSRRALELWPGNTFNQAEWLRAWRVLRSTTRGALADNPQRLNEQPGPGPFVQEVPQ